MYERVHNFGYFACVTYSVILTSCLIGCNGLKIKELRVPEVVQNGSVSTVVLDCDYTLESPEGLVVKWYFNDDPQPVYQWIPPNKPQPLGVLKDKLNVEYKASANNMTMYRALQILNPTTELSGDYRCTVSTFKDEHSLIKKMVVFVPEKSLEVKHSKQKDNAGVNITCTAEGVFPEPQLIILKEDRSASDATQVLTTPRDGLFDIMASIVLDDDKLSSPTKFDCELRIPEANYTARKQIEYYPGPPTTVPPELNTTSTEFYSYVQEANSGPGKALTNDVIEKHIITVQALPSDKTRRQRRRKTSKESNQGYRLCCTWLLLLTSLLCFRL